MDSPILTARIIQLETRLAYQDQTIEDLNAAVTAQWKDIDLLRRQLAKLTEEVKEAALHAREPNAPEPPPPHY
ncbi:SlyX family protein [Kaistia dalseonensis]|uniref:Protein SlyX homolog n=1 Tax=Kaistia dalseonensis TaxID=410840 RepID=A0ABU0H605_9HYPH|nr:SlyX family protein [Kaistia dalseonensis]MCX5495156.1 SlyX family protein [Kaistia dalseonensis]MDQ0437739.1 SlyX protein [Kaistia dalseonensis]